MMENVFLGAAGMLSQQPRSRSQLAQMVEASRARQADLQSKLDAAYRAGNHMDIDAHAKSIQAEMMHRTRLHQMAGVLPDF